MKPSGPGHSSFGRLVIADLNSLIDLTLFWFPVSPPVSFGNFYITRSSLISPKQSNLLTQGIVCLISFLKFQFIYLFIFPFIFISWRLITLQYCSGFCHTLTWISHGFTCVPHPDPPSHLPPHPIPLGHPSAPGPSTCLMHPAWAGDLFHPW